jgi:hypothetical protein
MNAGKRYGINEGEVVAQTFDDETVIINLARGYYYSVTGTASRMWALLCGGFTVEETAGAIAQAYGVDRQKVGADVQGLLDKLLQNSLVVESDAVPSGGPRYHSGRRIRGARHRGSRRHRPSARS